ncbi:putative methyltransferase Ppm1/Ppm2/Tcmp, S-adenosyl-L-methionine-dependent methyltransferase [Lupinus albus]|uniref:Putative methyltransferase Ppm1/Ppm2/Tcmp, S-adenosyl-L-methionine-dependent methyltransferase n=1 Tax=Lupinus albus TaxID=3870 RepID=A0A6A4PPV2_LUPAL|nr:putative methyltransferase Ppm1/Ppm2/Tcmp, S-adenosyl-L-methionine-dependent methyltransferase [Lupinus albus]
MSDKVNGLPEYPTWPELKLPELLQSEVVQQVHATIEKEWDFLQRSACQTAAGRALWKHVTHDPLAELLAGESYLTNLHEKIKKDCLKNATEISGVILAVRTLWFDSRIEDALTSSNGREAQVVLLGAGMDTRAYRLSCLKDSDVFEVDFTQVLQVKTTILQAAKESAYESQHIMSKAKSLTRVAADIRENDWLEKLQVAGFLPNKNTVWVLEVVLADFMNKSSTTLSNSTFHFYSDWPDHLLPSIGFTHVKLSQIGDPDAHFGLLNEPLNLFNKLRSLPRSVQTHPDDGTPCCRLYLVEASGSPDQGAAHKGSATQS